MDCRDPDKMLPHTKGLGNIIMVISELIVKVPRGELSYQILLFTEESIYRTNFTGKLSGVDSAGVMRQGVCP